MTRQDSVHEKAVIGNLNHDFWIYDSAEGFDLTRRLPSELDLGKLSNSIRLRTQTSPITLDPDKSALVIIDMQNFFLSTAIGRPAGSKGLIAENQLLRHAIPTARQAGIQIIWMNWGLSDKDLETLPPAVLKCFGFSTSTANAFDKMYKTSRPATASEVGEDARLASHNLGKDTRIYKGLGQSLGEVSLANGDTISAGRMLMRDQWNTELTPPLQESFRASSNTPKPDVWLNKNRISGMHLPDSPASLYLQKHNIKTLIFAGVNTDQCVNGTLCDAFCQGYDCILLNDACATTSPAGAQESVVFNVARTMGFVTDCEAFAQGVDASLALKHLW